MSKTSQQGQIAGGVIVSWGAQLILIAAGFVIPRWIDHNIGRTTLGVWDLAWSLVSYLTLVEAGIGSSVNRHVALHMAKADISATNRIVSSVALVQRGVGVIVILLTIGLAATLPHFLRGLSPGLLRDARWVVLILGVGVAFSLSAATYTGVLTGCHRWQAHHTVYACTNFFNAVGMCWALKAGFGIVALAAVHLVGEIGGRIARVILAYRSCPGLEIRLRNADLPTTREMIGFGGRMFVGRMSGVLLVQTVSVLVASYLGPAALALFARPRSLIRQAAVFPQKYGFMLAPAAAATSEGKPRKELQQFVKDSVRYGIAISLPVMLFLAIDGDLLLQAWMGGKYADNLLMIIMTIGFGAEIVYQPLNNLLLGLNLHGRPGLFSLVAAAFAAGLSWVALRSGAGLHGVALAVAIPWTLVHGIYVPVFACRRLGIGLAEFFREAWTRPMICAIPFAGALAAGKLLFPDQTFWAIASGCGLGGMLLLCSYWMLIFPADAKRRVRRLLGEKLQWRSEPAAQEQEEELEAELAGPR